MGGCPYIAPEILEIILHLEVVANHLIEFHRAFCSEFAPLDLCHWSSRVFRAVRSMPVSDFRAFRI
jgi:hypothetical protein